MVNCNKIIKTTQKNQIKILKLKVQYLKCKNHQKDMTASRHRRKKDPQTLKQSIENMHCSTEWKKNRENGIK